MKRNRYGMKRAMAVLLCFMLVLSGANTAAAGDKIRSAGVRLHCAERHEIPDMVSLDQWEQAGRITPGPA